MAEKNSALDFAQLQERGIRRVLHAVARKPAQNLLRFGSAKTQRCGKFDHLVVVLSNELPLDGAREHRLQVGIGIRSACFGSVQLLGMQIFQAGQQLEAQQGTESKSDLALAVSIDVVAIHLHL